MNEQPVWGDIDLARPGADQLAEWVTFCLAHPGKLPPETTVVQARLIRAVGRARLPSGDAIYLKVMGFPRARDRLRYWLRALPAPHEAAMLHKAAAAGVPCPQVAAAAARRGRLGAPSASVLATVGLDVLPGAMPRLHDCSVLARRLLEAQIAHPDLHEQNFVCLASGGVAVLDLQSARGCRRPSRGLRVRAAGRLLAADWPEPEAPGAVVASGLIEVRELPAALELAQNARVDAVRRRVRRCLMDSTEFCTRRQPWGRLVQRRELAAGGTWHDGGRTLIRVWLGARVCEVVDREPSILGALFRNSWWLPRRCSVYIAEADGAARFEERCARWLHAYDRFKNMTVGGRRGPKLQPEAMLPWSGRREV